MDGGVAVWDSLWPALQYYAGNNRAIYYCIFGSGRLTLE